MQRVMATVAAMLALGSSQALAQGHGRPLVEIGTGAGLTVLNDGSTITAFSVPGAGIFTQPAIYASFFMPTGLAIEPSTALNIVHSSGTTVTTLGFATMVGQFFKGAAASSPFVGAIGALESVSEGGNSASKFALGGRVGYRTVLPTGALAIRFEAGYQRWFHNGSLNEFTIGIALGGIIHSAK